MQVIFRDISQHKAKSETIAEYNDEEIFIETVLDKFDKIANEFNNSASLITNEMEGIFRVFEIIECTMWSEMVL